VLPTPLRLTAPWFATLLEGRCSHLSFRALFVPGCCYRSFKARLGVQAGVFTGLCWLARGAYSGTVHNCVTDTTAISCFLVCDPARRSLLTPVNSHYLRPCMDAATDSSVV